MTAPNIEEIVNQKGWRVLFKNITTKMEHQTTLLIEIFKKQSTPFTTSEFWVFQETFLKADDRLSFPNKIFFLTHRNNRTGGGLLIDIPPNMSGHVIFENSNDPNLEMLAVEIHSHNVTFTIVNIYAPHGFDIHQVQNFSVL
ncbi:hypothetical protein CEXT_448671 [Caerostris extrusa]|uniref:Uncharacterized protein n=1 Tax=Caerostris extrusa TaxID=172846 RepID=A0AAV4X547_CAEEX|nr:hypothetical protein CEXT_448671 [Caerostris extrusa]